MTISVALCTYNGEKYLRAQLQSIFTQTLAVDEIIICDDISTDNTCNIIKEFQKLFPNKITLIINSKTLGTKKNFEKAIDITNYDVIFLCDQDDVWPIGKVKKIIKAFKENPDVEGIFTNGILIDKDGLPIGAKLWNSFLYTEFIQTKLTKDNLFETILTYFPIITGATLAIKKEVKSIILPLKNSHVFWHDEWIGYRLAADKLLLPYNEPLLNYRIHDNQQVGIYTNNLENSLLTFESYFKGDIKPGDEKNYIYFMYERLKGAREICIFIQKQNKLVKRLENNFFFEKKRTLQKIPFLLRKVLLLKWVCENRFETTIKELFFT